jgi:hypothetical protein
MVVRKPPAFSYQRSAFSDKPSAFSNQLKPLATSDPLQPHWPKAV